MHDDGVWGCQTKLLFISDSTVVYAYVGKVVVVARLPGRIELDHVQLAFRKRTSLAL